MFTISAVFHFLSFLSLVTATVPVTFDCNDDASDCVLANGFCEVTMSLSGGAWVPSIRGDFHGAANFGNNLLSQNTGFRLEREDDDGTVHSAAGVGGKSNFFQSMTDEGCVKIEIPEVVDSIESPLSIEHWQFTMCPTERWVQFRSRGNTLHPTSNRFTIKSVRHSLMLTPVSVTAFFQRGVVQMMAAASERGYFGSSDALQRVYMVGETGSMDLVRSGAVGGESDVTVILSSNTDNNDNDYRSGYQEILAGSYNVADRDVWTAGWSSQTGSYSLNITSSWDKTILITPNQFNFPASSVSTSGSNMDDRGDGDLGAYMTGMYSNGVGCLCTFDNEVEIGTRVAQIATSLRVDNGRGYNNTYNYFDPDNFFALSGILYSGDAYLQDQVRSVIERTGSFMDAATGQLPHHFEGSEPQFVALSGETQTGPNIFWVKTALQYVASSGDYDWLNSYMQTLRTAAGFVFDLIEDDSNLLNAPGSLMIDVFIRNNYTSDSNAMLVGFLKDFADAELAVGNQTRSDELMDLSEKVKDAMNARLWASVELGADHYITQLNKYDGSVRDFVDYDANLIAVANGVADEDRARLIVQRIDKGQCSTSSGAGAQFVSEVYYGEEATTSGNTGDSWCSMGRIGWFDAQSRKRLGTADDLTYFDNSVLSPIQSDLLSYTWLHERYGCDGKQQENRTMYYFEYPALVSMLLKDIRYGVELSVGRVTVKPFRSTTLASHYEFHVGKFHVSYDSDYVAVVVPVMSSTLTSTVIVHGLQASADYAVTVVTGEYCEEGVSFAILGQDTHVTSTAEGMGVAVVTLSPATCMVTFSLISQ